MDVAGAAVAFHALGELLQQEELFVRRVRRHEEPHRGRILPPRGIDDVTDANERVLPGRRLVHAVLGQDQRLA